MGRCQGPDAAPGSPECPRLPLYRVAYVSPSARCAPWSVLITRLSFGRLVSTSPAWGAAARQVFRGMIPRCQRQPHSDCLRRLQHGGAARHIGSLIMLSAG